MVKRETTTTAITKKEKPPTHQQTPLRINGDLFALTSMLISGRISDKWNLFVGTRRLDTSGPPAIVFTDNSIVTSLNSLRVITIAR